MNFISIRFIWLKRFYIWLLDALKCCLNMFLKERILIENNQLRHYGCCASSERNTCNVSCTPLHGETISSIEDNFCPIKITFYEMPTIANNFFNAKVGSDYGFELSSPHNNYHPSNRKTNNPKHNPGRNRNWGKARQNCNQSCNGRNDGAADNASNDVVSIQR